MPNDDAIPWSTLESLLRRDPTRRGVASYVGADGPLCAGQLAGAAHDLAARATTVGIVTGFAIADAQPIAAETDGPPGALFLARTLRLLGVDALLISDRYGVPLLEVGCDLWGLPREIVHEMPLPRGKTGGQSGPSRGRDNTAADRWIEDFLRSGAGARLSHLVAIERVGPSHTADSLAAQGRTGSAPLADFERDVPEAHRDVCHSMRGQPIDVWSAPAHRLFEAAKAGPRPVTTIGIGDGGNEIGMGSIPWETLRDAITLGPGERVACRVATDYTLVAGVSDWAAYGLALLAARLRGHCDDVARWDAKSLRALIETLVRDAGAVDGVTARNEPSIDGLPLETYLQVFSGIRAACLEK